MVCNIYFINFFLCLRKSERLHGFFIEIGLDAVEVVCGISMGFFLECKWL